MDFDEQDLIILAELEDNSRVTLPVIAKKAKLTSEAVKYRIQRLKKKKILLRFIPKLDISKLEYDDDLVYLYLQNKGKELEERLISYLKNNLNIISIIKCPIQRVIVFHIHTQTSDEIRNIIFELRESQQDIIKDMSSTSVFKVHKDSHLPDGFFKKH